jgi:hypothetical protein
MSDRDIRKFVGDFTEALVKLALQRVTAVDIQTQAFGESFDLIADTLDWSDSEHLASGGIDVVWVKDYATPHRTLMHPDFVLSEPKWAFVADYLAISMVSEKLRKVLMPHLVKKRRPRVEHDVLLAEVKVLNHYLRLVQESGLTGDRIMAYSGDLRTHGQGQNDSGRIGAVGAAVAVLDALDEIRPGAVVSTYGDMPPRPSNSPADLVRVMAQPGYVVPRAVLLDSNRAIIFAADPDVAIVSRIGSTPPYRDAQEAYEEWVENKRRPAEERQSAMHQAALGEVKTALDVSNMHERLALGSRENREEAHAIRFLMMAILTNDILDPGREGRRAMYSRDAQRFQHVFNLYFVWGYDGARGRHAEHWEDFKGEMARWCGLT